MISITMRSGAESCMPGESCTSASCAWAWWDASRCHPAVVCTAPLLELYRT